MSMDTPAESRSEDHAMFPGMLRHRVMRLLSVGVSSAFTAAR